MRTSVIFPSVLALVGLVSPLARADEPVMGPVEGALCAPWKDGDW